MPGATPLPTPFVDSGLTALHIHLSLELTGVVLVIIALFAFKFTVQQVKEMQEGTRQQTQSVKNQELQTRAGVLLSLDQRWESEPMLTWRAELTALIVDVKNAAERIWRGQADSEILRRSSDLYAERLARMAEESRTEYLRLMGICGFFETVGCVVRAGYVTEKDVLNLLDVSISTAAMVCRPHIQKLLEDGAPANYFENFLWIAERAERR